MADIEASYVVGTDETVELDEARSYTLVCSSTGTVAVDGGVASTMHSSNSPVIVVGPGVGKLVFATWRGAVIPRSDSRM